jgi:hypothetical protein
MVDRRRTSRERRGGTRCEFVASVHQQVGEHRSLALAQNLGEHGMELRRRADSWLDPSAKLELTFELPDGGDAVQLHGRVVFEHSEGAYHRIGIRFSGVSAQARARIQRYLRGVAPQPRA